MTLSVPTPAPSPRQFLRTNSVTPLPSVGTDTQLNWLARYVPLREHLTGESLKSLLEVGSGPRGLSCIIGNPFVSFDTSYSMKPAATMVPFAYEGGTLPLKDGAFDTVVSMDTLEHVPPTHRAFFLRELTRVASARVLIGFPSGQQDGEQFLQMLFRKLGMADPEWLHEHELYGLPAAEEIEDIFRSMTDFTFQPIATTGNLMNLVAVLMDVLPNAQPWVRPALGAHRAELEAWMRAGMFGPADRKVYLLERKIARTPLAHLSDLGSIVSALSCPDCRGDIHAAAEDLRCSGGHRFFPDLHGVIRLVRTPSPVAFVLKPNWIKDRKWVTPLYNYLHTFTPNDKVALWLHVDPSKLSDQDALSLLAPLFEPFGGNQVAQIMLGDLTQHPPSAARIIQLDSLADVSQCDSNFYLKQYYGADAQSESAHG